MEFPVDAEVLIPHRKPMRLIDRLDDSDGESGVGQARFNADCPFVSHGDGKIDRSALVELIAQTYAAARGYEDLSSGIEPSQGYLVAISKAVFHGDAYAEQDLLIKVRTKESFDGFFITGGEVFQNEKLILEASLTIWIEPNIEP